MAYQSQLLSVPELFDELVNAGRTQEQAGREIEQALRDGALKLLDMSEPQREDSKIIGEAIQFLHSLVKQDRTMINPYLAMNVRKLFALRFNFEAVCGLVVTDTPESPGLKKASPTRIRDAIALAYDRAAAAGDKAPNINQITVPVKEILAAEGYDATGAQIKTIAEDDEFAQRRQPTGKRVH